jgi:hypothetical protein
VVGSDCQWQHRRSGDCSVAVAQNEHLFERCDREDANLRAINDRSEGPDSESAKGRNRK